MTKWYAAMVAGCLLATGCNNSEPGGPNAGTKKPVVGETDNTFTLSAPSAEMSIKQGENKTANVSISRGKNFDQDVKLEFSDPPKGVTIMPHNPMIHASDKEVQLTIEAAKDAALGHHTITVWGTPAREGAKTSVTVKIEVKAAS